MERQATLWLEPLPALGGVHASAEEASLAGLSGQERAWAARLAPLLRQRYAASRCLMRQRLAPLLGCSPERVPLDSPPGSRPRLQEGAGWLSLSHSGAALLLAWSPRPIGVDLEWSGRVVAAAALQQRYFPALERQQLQALPAAELRLAVLRSWVVKEAAIKWRGETLASDLRHWSWDERCGSLRHGREGLAPPVVIRQLTGWLCAAVGEGVAAARWAEPLGPLPRLPTTPARARGQVLEKS
ncbi:MAG: 4'-phosphopantetheinyl transferase superfamily protein [Prochlorococcaceae cyanobacterium]